jgi:pimeloyl-ACP methyl ester carboxylesterase
VAKDLTARPDSKGAGRARANAASDDWSRPRLLHFLAMVLAHAPGAHLRELAAPTLLIHGERDPILSERAQLELLERLPHARLESLAGVGHDLVAEAPAATADLSLAFTRMDQHETG